MYASCVFLDVWFVQAGFRVQVMLVAHARAKTISGVGWGDEERERGGRGRMIGLGGPGGLAGTGTLNGHTTIESSGWGRRRRWWWWWGEGGDSEVRWGEEQGTASLDLLEVERNIVVIALTDLVGDVDLSLRGKKERREEKRDRRSEQQQSVSTIAHTRSSVPFVPCHTRRRVASSV